MKDHFSPNMSDYFEVLQPENELEEAFLRDPEFVRGLDWGVPRYGHPEGEVYKHIREVLDNVDRLQLPAAERYRLRLITFAHDTFKYKEHKGHPRDWTRHHSVLARKFLEKYTSDEQVLEITELHDEAYYSWCTHFLHHKPKMGAERLNNLLDRIGDYIQLYYLFFKCDTCTGDKTPAPLKWVEATLPGIEVVKL